MSTFSLILPSRDPTSTAMPPTLPELEGLRRRLDEIDDRLQDLLIERAEIIAMVTASKKDRNQPAFQPAREAEIIRRLVGRHHGAFPVATLVRMWREMLAATVRLQAPFSVAVFAPSERQGYWDLARDHYGSFTPMATCDAVGPLIRAVAGGEASLGVLPMPRANETEPWWLDLSSMSESRPRVIARLPFGPRGTARDDDDEALVIALDIPQKSGLDRTLFAVECSSEITHARMLKLLSAAGLVCTSLLNCRRDFAVHLIEIEGFVPISDARLATFRANLGPALRRLLPFGAYATPLSPAALVPAD
jgi:chorismate mutase / prephenate dehydratase